MNEYRQRIERCHDDFLQKLITVLKFPSVSADPAFDRDLRACADWVSDYLRNIGGSVEQIHDYGRPIVYAEFAAGAGKPTVLLYGHYDVQPANDRSLWPQDPFEPRIDGRRLVARGASDNKGPFMAYLAALEVCRAAGRLPVNVKIVLEGEEESSGRAIFDLVEKQTARLKCDLVVSTDASGFFPGQPAITYGTRGLVYKQIDLYGPRQDLHSGSFGGAVQNPASALALMLGSLFDANGHINIPGIYDKVRPLGADERQGFRELEFNEQDYCAGLGISRTISEPGFSPVEQLWCRPNLAVNGFMSGYTGEGAKTVLPATAMAKLSMRLVPDQDPEEISALMDAHLKRICPPGVRMEITNLGMAEPFLGPREGPAVDAATAAIEKAFGARPAFIREGGTLPIMAHFKEYLTENILIIGLTRPDSGAHGPNEYFHLDDFGRGIEMCCVLFEQLAERL